MTAAFVSNFEIPQCRVSAAKTMRVNHPGPNTVNKCRCTLQQLPPHASTVASTVAAACLYSCFNSCRRMHRTASHNDVQAREVRWDKSARTRRDCIIGRVQTHPIFLPRHRNKRAEYKLSKSLSRGRSLHMVPHWHYPTASQNKTCMLPHTRTLLQTGVCIARSKRRVSKAKKRFRSYVCALMHCPSAQHHACSVTRAAPRTRSHIARPQCARYCPLPLCAASRLLQI